MATEPIVVVGLGGVFPGASTVDRLWDVVESATDCSSEPHEGRWILPGHRAHDEAGPRPDRVYSRRACFLHDFVFDPDGLQLDAGFLLSLDPSVHVAVHAGREAWAETATDAVDPTRVGVVLGNIVLPTSSASAMSDWILGRQFERELFRAAGVPMPSEQRAPVPAMNRFVAGLPAGILARSMGFGGGHFTLDAACASSLFALELAVDALRSGRTDAMLTGGLARPDCLYTQMGFSQLRALSKRGRCAPFDRKADGLVVGEGACVLVLKRLSDALRHGDRIRAVIRGIGLSNDVDGNLLAPSEEGQLRAMRAAYRDANWQPRDVELVECHATGTPVGDAVELRSLSRLWSEEESAPDGEYRCVIGSAKSNVGHLLTGAGAVGLAKTIFALERGVLPPTANFEAPAEGVELDGSPFRVLREAEPWARRGTAPRRAAVSGFGFGGTNAHVLIEEARDLEPVTGAVSVPVKLQTPAIAIVGMDAKVGPWNDLCSLQPRLLGVDDEVEPTQKRRAWGQETVPGFFIEDLDVAVGQFRIPPKEIEEAQPQQILMLQVARRVLEDASVEELDKLRTGVFIGVDLDLNTTNYHLRWSLRSRARAWASSHGRAPEGAEFERWVDRLCDAISPALDANRTMGGLASITASRIARELGVGGPSYVLASEEASGLAALQSAVSALQRGQLDCALVGAVDLQGDVRGLLAADGVLGLSPKGALQALDRDSDGLVPADGAVALVLKREEDARRDGDRIYAVVRGIGSASGDPANGAALGAAIDAAHVDAGISPDDIAYLEAHGSGVPQQDRVEASVVRDRFSPETVVASVKASVGHLGSAAGLMSVVRAALCLYQQVLPAMPQSRRPRPDLLVLGDPEPWLRDRARGARLAGVSAMSVSGACVHVVLEGRDDTAIDEERAQPLGPPGEGLFVVEADDVGGLQTGLARLAAVAKDSPTRPIDQLARGWYAEVGQRRDAHLAMSLVATDAAQLLELASGAETTLTHGGDPEKTSAGRVYFSRQPLGADAPVALVFPGSGNQFRGMGRAIGLAWPEVLRAQDRSCEHLRSQLLPSRMWRSAADDDPRAVILSQVSLGTVVSDVVKKLGLRPAAVIGYSLGETAGLFSLGAWHERDEMLRRVVESNLFTEQLAGPCRAAARAWQLPENEPVHWVLGVVDRPAAEVRTALEDRSRAYLLIVNTPDESVIGGDAEAVEATVKELGASFHPLPGITTVHCDVARQVADAYRELHLLETHAPEGVRFYSGAWGGAYDVDREKAADSILAQALHGIDFPKTIRQAYEDGVRVFLEVGPGASCSRMIRKILGDRPLLARSLCSAALSGRPAVLRTLAALVAERVSVDLDALYPPRREPVVEARGTVAHLDVGRGAFAPLPAEVTDPGPQVVAVASSPVEAMPADAPSPSLATAALQAAEQTALAHEVYLRLAESVRGLATRQVALQMELGGATATDGIHTAALRRPALRVVTSEPKPLFDRSQCMEIAVGSMASVLGERFAEVDQFPTRVRLPDEPLMLVDRIIELEGEPLSMSSGRVVTEHDVLEDGWYLDGGRIPTCIAVEAGQADLFLSGYLGVDFETRGLAMYRLLDADVTFLDELPGPGKVIRYDIRIKEFFRQGDTWLFRFEFDGTVDGRPLLTMRDGCAGFFSQAQLDAGKGIVRSAIERRAVAGKRPEDWRELVPMRKQSLSSAELVALRAGDLTGAFGDEFGRPGLRHPLTLPTGRMELVHRVTELDPQGGRYGLGSISAEADIHAQDWFLTCHFSDDQVMPGTLMYECCLHTLRVFLLRMGWIVEADEARWQPVVGVKSRLRCRGQVLPGTKIVTYEVAVSELGYGPEPYAICDALMYADGKPIVDIRGMSIQLTGTNRDKLEGLWAAARAKACGPDRKAPVYDEASIVAFAGGKPSEAFGEPYRIFDGGERRIARLPRDPYRFLDRVTAVSGAPFVMKAGARAEAQFDLSPDSWVFESNRQHDISFAVLLEAALQPCGWLAAYVGSALTSPTDLRFRNLGGEAVLLGRVDRREDVLTTRVELQKVSNTAGMVIQHFSFEVVARGRGTVYQGTTYFGFFPDEALAEQVGIREQTRYVASDAERRRGTSFEVPRAAPFPDERLRMVDRVDLWVPDGGPSGLGLIEGSIDVDASEWFFEAHFLQDPVWPGSLGLEAMVQLLKVYATKHWQLAADTRFATMPLQARHGWTYRGQILPSDRRVEVQAIVTGVDEEHRIVTADGYLAVDGRLIYAMHDFALEVRP